MEIQMVDLKSQYRRLEAEIDEAVKEVLNATAFINGPQVRTFCGHLADYLQVPYVIPCGNGTDALRLAYRHGMYRPETKSSFRRSPTLPPPR